MSLILKNIWFDFLALALSEPLSGKPKPEKIVQRAISRDRKLVSNFFLNDQMWFWKLQMHWKYEQNPGRNDKDIDSFKIV